MNFALSDEQEFLKEAARGALVARADGRGRARGAGRRRAARPVAHRGRGGLARPARLRRPRRRRARRARGDAGVRGARPRARVRPAARPPARDRAARRRRAASRRSRPATPAPRSCPPGRRPTSTPAWTTEPPLGLTRAPAPAYADGTVTGRVAWVPDAPGADAFVVVLDDGRAAYVEDAPRSSRRTSTTSPAASAT